MMNKNNHIKKCARTEYCGISGWHTFPECLTGNDENDWQGKEIKNTKEALRQRGFGVCLYYSIDADERLDRKKAEENKDKVFAFKVKKW